MKRFALILCGTLGILISTNMAHASGCCGLTYGGQQPWWNIFNCHNRHLTCEEQRLQRFWHDYYDALRKYYKLQEHIDWVAYYKNHGYQINAACGGMGMGPCGGCQRIQFAPVFVSPQMQWAVPNGCLTGAPSGPPCCGPGMGPMGQ